MRVRLGGELICFHSVKLFFRYTWLGVAPSNKGFYAVGMDFYAHFYHNSRLKLFAILSAAALRYH